MTRADNAARSARLAVMRNSSEEWIAPPRTPMVSTTGTPQAAMQGLLFRLDVQEAVTVRLGEPADHLVITSWTPGRGLREVRRT